MSRINVSALQRPASAPPQGGSGQPDFPEVNISPDGWDDGSVGDVENESVQTRQDNLAPHLERISSQLEQQTNNMSQNQLLAQLGADPQIQALLAARQAGKKVKVLEDDEAQSLLPEPQANEQEPNWEELGQNPQKMALHVVKTVGNQIQKALVPSLLKMVDSKLQPVSQLAQQVQEISNMIGGFQKQQVQSEYDTIRNQDPETFDRLKPLMSEILKEAPGMKVGRLFTLAKAEANVSSAPDQRFQTERPTAQSARPAHRDETNPHAHLGNMAVPGRVRQRQRLADPQAQFSASLADLLEQKDFSGLPGVTM